jgi:hypothetical protein
MTDRKNYRQKKVRYENDARIIPSSHYDLNSMSQAKKIQNDFLSSPGVGDSRHMKRTINDLEDINVRLSRFSS